MADFNNTNRRIASVEDFKNRAQETITLTDYDVNNEKYCLDVVVRKTSLTNLLTKGVIPNSLLQRAQGLTDPNRNNKPGKSVSDFSEDEINASMDAMRKIAEATLISPPFEEVGEFLTDSHLSQIVSYVTGGVQSLENFRNQQEDTRRNTDSEQV